MKDPWLKKLKKSYEPDVLADLIKRRIDFPYTTGPIVCVSNGEISTDIIANLCSNIEFKAKIQPAVGLILFNILEKKDKEDHDILKGVFALIRDAKLFRCAGLLNRFLQEKVNNTVGDNQKWKTTYREAMMAYAHIQTPNKDMEKYWDSVWASNTPTYWAPAFYGLRMQNPSTAIKNLPKLIERNVDKKEYLLYGLWLDTGSRYLTELALKKALVKDERWAGICMNLMCKRMSEIEKEKLLLDIKEIEV